jgi:predicted Fe-S protein YdhL (DUF1289 family)
VAVSSPCIDLCRLNSRTGICVGCVRTAEEIRVLRKLTEHQRRRMLGELRQQRAFGSQRISISYQSGRAREQGKARHDQHAKYQHAR